MQKSREVRGKLKCGEDAVNGCGQQMWLRVCTQRRQILHKRKQIFCSRFTKEELSLNLNIAPKQKWSSGAAELSNMGSYSNFSKEGPTYLMKKTLVTVAACLVLSLLPLAGCVSEAHPPTRNCGRLPWPMRYLARTTR